MRKKTEKMDVVATNSLMELGIEKMIQVIRGKQVLLDRDLAALYGVETKVLNQAVKRNAERFPERNCFQLTESEFANWKSQIVISNADTKDKNLKSQIVTSSWGGTRKMPFAFTE